MPHPEYKYQDPHSNDRGLLLSDQIDELCQAGFIISKGYDRKYLRPSSYTLTIGEWYFDSNGKPQRLPKIGDSFVFKKNSIVYVCTEEELDLPYYIVARFNLRVHWVYEGILLGTGPQVDPGFRGILSCPLYNLTNIDLTIKRGEEFATIDFEKTTTFLDGCDEKKKRELMGEAGKKDFLEVNNRFYKLFRQAPLAALEHHPKHVLISSLVEMKNEVRTWRNIGLAFAISFFALTLTLLSFGTNVFRQANDVANDGKNLRSAIQNLDEDKKRWNGEIDHLKQRIAALEMAAQEKESGASQPSKK